MPNPYKSTKPIRVAHESVSELDQTLARLRRLGLDDDGLADVREHWDDFNDDWTPEVRRELVRATDSKLRDLIEGVYAEYKTGTVDEAEDAASETESHYLTARADALGRMGDTIPGILEWVAADPVRARAVRDLETVAEGANRKTLVEKLDALIEDDAPVA